MEDSLSSTGPFGWEVLKCPAVCNVDIVFLHGLIGGRRSTFTHKNGRCWPQDFLPDDLPYARIMTFGYDANIVSFERNAGQNSLEGNAKSLLDALRHARPDAARPIIFVTHSLGGLLCKKVLLMSQSRLEFRPIFDAFAGIMFIGTPHKGSKQARLGTLITNIVNIFRSANKDLVGTLKVRSESLLVLDDEFWALMDGEKRNCAVHCYNESAPITGLGIIVDHDSASRPGGSSSPLDGTHRTMLKFASNRDAGYLSISSKLVVWARDLPSPLQAASKPPTAAQPLAPEDAEAHVPTAESSHSDQGSSASSSLANNPDSGTQSPLSNGAQSAALPRAQTKSNVTTPNTEPPSAVATTSSNFFPFDNCTFHDKVFPGMANHGNSQTLNFH